MKRTGFKKVIAKRAYRPTLMLNRIQTPPYKEMVWVLDLTSKK